MNAGEILTAVSAGEDKEWEFKSAKGGMPGSLWETYSAMANTDGGVIVLGVKEHAGEFEIQGLDDPARMEKDFWNTANNRGKVNINLLSSQAVSIVLVDGKPVLVIQVPRASRRQRPIYVGQNPLTGTFRRYSDGDYQCSREEVGRMLADQADQSADCEILIGFQIEDLDKRSLEQYRNRFASRAPTHPWLKSDDKGLLEKLGGWRKDRVTGQEGVTVAGLLMFGKDEVIRDPAGVPQFDIDYRERLSADPRVRWTDRIWRDGTWVGNLFQFFERVYPRLVMDLKIPFQLVISQESSSFQRHDDTIIHEAIREALVNALIHADYRGQGGVIIERFRDRLEFSNPGTLLLGIDQIMKGAVSECRNKTLQVMFAMLGYGEKAGSGIDKIYQGWASQKWCWPILEEAHRPDRVQLTLPMVSLLPEESLSRLRTLLGEDLAGLNAREVQTLVMADLQGSVTNSRLQQFGTDHASDLTRLLQDLVAKGLLVKSGYGRWATYQLSPQLGRSAPNGGGTPDITTPAPDITTPAPDITTPAPAVRPETDPGLLAIAEPARTQARLSPDEMRRVIRALCQGQFLTVRELATLLNREPMGLQRWTLRPMAQEQQLRLAHPETPSHPRQAYQTNPDWSER